MRNVDPAALGADIERLLQQIGQAEESPLAERAQELVRLLMALYGAGLSRVLEIVRTEQGGPDATLRRLARDPFVASLLVLHDLHPEPIDRRVERALAELQPSLPGGTQVTVTSATADDVRVLVRGPAAPGRPGPLRLAIERAIQEAAPEAGVIQVDGLGEELLQIARRPLSSTSAPEGQT